MAEPVRHVAKFWRLDQQIEAARKHAGWATFHRECGAQGLFFDDIEKQGRGYSAISFRVETRGEYYATFRVSKGTGRSPIDAVLGAFTAAVDAGFAVDPTLGALLTVVQVAPEQDWDALIDGAPETPQDELMDLIG